MRKLTQATDAHMMPLKRCLHEAFVRMCIACRGGPVAARCKAKRYKGPSKLMARPLTLARSTFFTSTSRASWCPREASRE